MQTVLLTTSMVKSVFSSVNLMWFNTEYEAEVKMVVDNVLAHCFGSALVSSSELAFVSYALSSRNKIYVRPIGTESPLTKEQVSFILDSVRVISPTATEKDILVADKMDILYGDTYGGYLEYGKFDMDFYEMVFSIVSDLIADEVTIVVGNDVDIQTGRQDVILTEVLRYLETIISFIERDVALSGLSESLEDTFSLCVTPFLGELLFLLF